METEATKTITKDAFLWLVFGGLFAICLASTLLYIDHRLSVSTGEQDRNVLLQRVRTAQAELNTGAVDPRQNSSTLVTKRLSELEKE